MALFKMFDKIDKVFDNPISASDPQFDSFDVVSWGDHKQEIMALMSEVGIDVSKANKGYLKCQLIKEPTNESDPNAIKVLGAVKGKNTVWHDIGYVPRDMTKDVKKAQRLVDDKTHFWSLYYRCNVVDGTSFTVYLNESKFSK